MTPSQNTNAMAMESARKMTGKVIMGGAMGILALAASGHAFSGGFAQPETSAEKEFLSLSEMVSIMVPAADRTPSRGYDRFGAFVDQGYVFPGSPLPDGEDWSKVSFTGKDDVRSHVDLTDEMFARADLAAAQVKADMIVLDYASNMEVLMGEVSQDDFIRSYINRGREETLQMVKDLSNGVIESSAFSADISADARAEASAVIAETSDGFALGTSSDADVMKHDFLADAWAGKDVSDARVVTTQKLSMAQEGRADVPHVGIQVTREPADVLMSQIVQPQDLSVKDAASDSASRPRIGIIAASMRQAGIEVSETDAIVAGVKTPEAELVGEFHENDQWRTPEPGDSPRME